MMNRKRLFIAAALFCVSGCSVISQKERVLSDPRFLNVVSNPTKFDGRPVEFIAWITLRHEDKNLWLTPADRESWNLKHCISLDNPELLKKRFGQLDHQYVKVKGVFVKDASESGKYLRLEACNEFAIRIDKSEDIRMFRGSELPDNRRRSERRTRTFRSERRKRAPQASAGKRAPDTHL